MGSFTLLLRCDSLRVGHTRQDVEVSPSQSRISPSLQRVLGQTGDSLGKGVTQRVVWNQKLRVVSIPEERADGGASDDR